MERGEVLAVCVGLKKGTKKTPVKSGFFKENFGLLGDAHAEEGSLRQVSLLCQESIIPTRGLGLEIRPGEHGENITLKGIELYKLILGTRIRVGEVILEITQIGKAYDSKCAICREVGRCVMCEQGVSARVIHGGIVKVGDEVLVIKEGPFRQP